MTEEVALTVERAAVAISVVGSFTAIVLTGHLDSTSATILGPIMGAVAVAWFGGHSSQVQQQTSTPPPAPAPKQPAA